MTLDLHQTYQAIGLLISIGVVINSLEWIRLSRHLKPGGLMARRRDGACPKGLRGFLSSSLDPPVFTVLFIVRLLCALAVVACVFRGTLPAWALWLIFATNLVANYRLETASGAAESLGLVVIFTCAAYLNGAVSESFASIGLWFVAIHTCIAYVSNGLVKIQSKLWCQGTFISHLFSGSRFRNDSVGGFLARHVWVSKFLCWSTILGECLFPVVLWVGDELRIVLLAGGFLFHLGIGVLMGLNNFFWTFVATYPCFLYLGRQ